MKQHQIYGITGSKQHGKSTLARMIQQESHEPYVILHFADALKRICKMVFNLSELDVNGDLEKERRLPQPVIIDNYLETLSDMTQLKLVPHQLTAETPRQILQYVGTNYVRSCCPTYWLDRVEAQLQLRDNIVLPDCRFQNEADLIRKYEGQIVRIVNLDRPTTGDPHPSEMEMASIKADYSFQFHQGDFGGIRKAAGVLVKAASLQ